MCAHTVSDIDGSETRTGFIIFILHWWMINISLKSYLKPDSIAVDQECFYFDIKNIFVAL